ncbi:MAG: hypothetical protein ACREJ6_00870 [Candidatus Methylomirabilis sp.]
MKDTMLGLAGNAVENCLIFAVGVSPAAVMASVTFTWSAVRSSLGPPTQWVTSRRTTMMKYLLPIIAVILAAGLAGCAGQSDQHIQFFKAYGPGQAEQRHLGMHIISVSQTDQTPPVPK